MAFTSIGYDGTINERQWAELVPNVGSSTYGIKDADDLKVTAVPGQPLMVSIASGAAWGHGVLDTETANTTITCGTISSGSRWDLIAIRRNWQPLAGGPTSIVVVAGSSAKVIPEAREKTPGVTDDQPLALVQWTAGQTQPTAVVDLRCWAGNGGLVARDTLALTYLDKPGASVTIAGAEWNCVVGNNDTVSWVMSTELGRVPVFGLGSAIAGTPAAGTNFLIQAGSSINTTDGGSYSRIAFPNPFPNGLLSITAMNGDDWATGGGMWIAGSGAYNYHGNDAVGTKTAWVYALLSTENGQTGRVPRTRNVRHRVNWVAIGW